ncbi:MAG TPA: nucleotide exchange factor GrpE [Amycolatopsis sp.]|uniref:nucleotide exchange factor GrpE n=1 Tax=Amycolatopsis sp. TaxID=37632 RepID=UPI002B45DFE8|nr:nucleotide exchange factor GrpE [Amycolatopsis sp.]HKS48325.1 nucleotide exchange factor GrpE [Amycolatopsis sp.]
MGDAVVDEPPVGPPGDEDRPELAELVKAVAGLADEMRGQHARAEARERVIDQLHTEVERLRVGEEGILLRPVVTDLQRLRADLLHQARTLPAELGPEQAAKLLESFALSVELALERCGSVPVRPEIGAAFSPREHRAMKVVEAASEEEDGTIAEVVADGYLDTKTNRVTAPSRVHVRRWTSAENPESEGNTDV